MAWSAGPADEVGEDSTIAPVDEIDTRDVATHTRQICQASDGAGDLPEHWFESKRLYLSMVATGQSVGTPLVSIQRSNHMALN